MSNPSLSGKSCSTVVSFCSLLFTLIVIFLLPCQSVCGKLVFRQMHLHTHQSFHCARKQLRSWLRTQSQANLNYIVSLGVLMMTSQVICQSPCFHRVYQLSVCISTCFNSKQTSSIKVARTCFTSQ